jgi:hypothetical protein
VAAVVGQYQFQRYREQSDELWKWFPLPYWQGAAGMGRAVAELDRITREEPGNPFMLLLPAVGTARLRLAQVERSVAALRLLEALRAHAAAHDGRLPESLEDATDLPLSKAGSTAHFEAPVVAERVASAVRGREPDAKHASYEGRVMCFFEIGDGKGTLLRFDYDHPPRPPKPNRVWHLGKVMFNKAYWMTVPKGRV